MSGLPKPRSTTSRPSRRSRRFSSSTVAKTYGGRSPTRRNSIVGRGYTRDRKIPVRRLRLGQITVTAASRACDPERGQEATRLFFVVRVRPLLVAAGAALALGAASLPLKTVAT